jgi:hypothetical protein
MLVLHYRAIPELRRHVEQSKTSAPPTTAPHRPPPRPHPRLAAPGSSASQTTKCGWARQITGRRRPTRGVGTSGR